MKCFNCGKTIDDGIMVCPYCKKEQGISRELFEAAKAQNQQACTQIYNCCYGNVYYTVKSMIKDEDTIQDIVQDTFIQAFRSLEKMEYMEGRFQAWIRRIAHNTTVNYTRKKKPVLFSEMESDDEESELDFRDERTEHLPEEVIDRNETARLIQEILNTLSEEQRMAVGMYYYERQSIREIAETMGVSEGTVKSRLNYARKKIEEKVRELEKKGTKLYGLSPIPFLLFLFWNQGIQAAETPNTGTLQLVQEALSTAQEGGAAAGKISTAAVEKTTATAAEKTAEAAAAEKTAAAAGAVAAKGLGWKIAAGVVAIGLVGGGVAYAVSNQSPKEAVVVQPETESELPVESETVSEPESETETVIVEEVPEPNAMIADVPDWEAEEQIVLGNANLLRSEVTSITFLNSAEELTGYTDDMVWDVSAEGDGSVMAYAVENAEADYALYIVSKSGVYANADSSYMFAYYSSVTSIALNELFNTDYVTDMSYMFEDCHMLVTIDVSGFDTANVTDMSYMFAACESLERLDVSSFDTSQVTSMAAMFQICSSLTSLDVSNFDTGNVENMESMFSGCASLTSLDVSNFRTGNVYNMNGMFSGCYSLTTFDVSNFDTFNVINMSDMFYGCTSLSIDLSSFDLSNVSDLNNMTEGCKSVTGLSQ